MKKFLLLSAILCVSFTLAYSQNQVYNNTGNERNGPYGYKNWSWDNSAYKKHEYVSPVDNHKMPYRLLSPPNNNTAQKYPLFIMLHGGGEGMGGECDTERGTNECQLVWGGKILKDSINKYPGYAFFPQTWGAWWGNAAGADYEYLPGMEAPMRTLIEIIETVLLKNYNIDPDRIYISGVSNGAKATWELIERRPDLFAAAMPLSGMGNPKLASKLINSPIWNFQGGKDTNPNPFETERMYNALVTAGGNPKRSLYVDRDHWSWVDAFHDKTFLKWVYAQDKKKINILFGKQPTIPANGGLDLGISSGYKSYQWKLNGVNIAGATSYIYKATANGTYTVSFQRFDGTTAQSYPLTIGGAQANASPSVNAGADKSVTLPVNSIVLTGAASDIDGTIATYTWTKVNGPTATISGQNTSSLSVSGMVQGIYTFRLTVKDNKGASAYDDVIVTVGNAAAISITGITLVDADADKDVSAVTSGMVINLATQPYNMSFVAKTSPASIGSVKWMWNGNPFKTVQITPYSFTDNCWPNYVCYNGWWRPAVGTHTLTAIPYSGVNGTGTAGTPYTVQVKVVNSAARQAAESISELSLLDVSVGPNPASDRLNVELRTLEDEVNFTLTDNYGRVVLSDKQYNISQTVLNLSDNITPGIYFLNITTSSFKAQTVKFTKE